MSHTPYNNEVTKELLNNFKKYFRIKTSHSNFKNFSIDYTSHLKKGVSSV